MSDRVDTEALRAEWSMGGTFWGVSPSGSAVVLALCDELDRTREAAGRFKNATEAYLAEFDYPTLVPSWREFAAAGAALGRALRAALAESGNTEPKACPTCGEPGDGDCVGWGATDTEGDE